MAISTWTATNSADVAAKIAENHFALYVESALKKAKYKEIEMTRKDIHEALAMFPGLKPILDTFFFNDGSEKQLMSLAGTIPVIYKDVRYNIPVIIWLLDTHPDRGPKIYVQPTTEMRIKPSRYVNQNGEVHLPWQISWNPVTSNLRRTLCDVIDLFERKPPVYSIAK